MSRTGNIRRAWQVLRGHDPLALNVSAASSLTVYDHRSDHWRPPVTTEGGSYFAVLTPEGELLVEIRDAA